MLKELFNDIKKSIHIKLIGLSVIGSSENKLALEECIFSRIEKGELKCDVIAESDNQLFQQSLMTDSNYKNRISFEQFKIIKNFFIYEITKNEKRKENSIINISSLNLPFYCVLTDQNLWYLPCTDFNINNFFIIEKNNFLYNYTVDYLKFLDDPNGGCKFIAKPEAEMLELFDQNKVPRGIFPRDSFYDTDHFQYVVWGLVFNREGKMLIHKRKHNAKDNQNMWDKSIGGHIDFEKEKSTQEAVVRELIEELYTEEKSQQSGHGFSMLSEDISKVYFLGDWRLENNGPDYFNQISLLESKKKDREENWVFYRLPTTFTHNTPRVLPDNQGECWLRVMVDVFVFITNTEICDEYLKLFKNSQYLLVESNELKTWMENGIDNQGDEFLITPDLKYIMTGQLRNIIDEVTSTIKFSNIRK